MAEGHGRILHPRLLECWRASLESGQPGEAEARLRRGDGTYRWFLFRSSPMRDTSGSIIQWLGSIIDIDDGKRAQEALAASERDLRLLINSIPMSILVLQWMRHPASTWRRTTACCSPCHAAHAVQPSWHIHRRRTRHPPRRTRVRTLTRTGGGRFSRTFRARPRHSDSARDNKVR
jgi:PAS domain-containing protein